MTRLALLCDRIIEAGWLAALVTVPLYFNIYSSRVFEPDKLIALRSIVLIMCLAYVVRFLETRTEQEEAEDRAPTDRLDDERPFVPIMLARMRAANPLALPALGLAMIYIVSGLLSIVPATSLWGSYQRLQGTYSYLTYIALFFLTAQNLRTKAQVDRFIKVALLTSVPISLYGLAQHYKLDPLPWGGDVTSRVASSMGNAIFVAAYIIMVVPLVLARLVDTVRKLRRQSEAPTGTALAGGWHLLALIGLLVLQNLALILFVKSSVTAPNMWWGALPTMGLILASSLAFVGPRDGANRLLFLIAETVGYSALLVLQVVVIFLSGSRGPEIGLGAGLVAFVILLARRLGSRRLLLTSSAVSGILVALVILMNVPNSPVAKLNSVPYIGRLGSVMETDSGTNKVRLLIWEGDIQLLKTFPSVGFTADPLRFLRPLIGYGPEALYVAYNGVYPPDLAHYEARNASPDRSHQDTLDYLTMTGILGLIAFFTALVVGLFTAWRAARRSHDPGTQILLVGIIAAVIAHFIETQVGIAIASTLTYMWALFGLVIAIRAIEARSDFSAPAMATAQASAGLASGSANSSPFLKGRGQGDGSSTQAANSRPSFNDRKSKKSGQRSPGISNARRPRSQSVAATTFPISGDFDNLFYAGAYVLITSMGLLWLWSSRANADVAQYYAGGFAWLAVGIVAVALSLGRWPRFATWQPANFWVYIPLAILAAVLIWLNLAQVVADIQYKRGFSLDSQGQWEQAIPAYQEALKLTPNQDFYYLFLGRAFLELGKRAERPNINPPGIATADKARTVSYQEVTKLGKGDLLQLSRAALEQARELNPLNTDHYANLARLYRYWGELGDKGNFDKSIDYYSKATTLSPHAAHLFAEWSEVYLAKGDTTNAVEKAKRGIELDAIYAPNYIYLGDAYLAAGQPQDALDAHLKALQIDPVSMSDARLQNRITSYQQANLLDKLEAGYAQATQSERGRDQAAVHSARGYILAWMGKTPEATEEFRTWVKLAPSDWLAHRNLALVYANQGMIDQAVAEGTEARRLAPADQQASMQTWISDTAKRKQ